MKLLALIPVLLLVLAACNPIKLGPAFEVTPPPNASTPNSGGELLDVSCTSPSNCVAVGMYANTNGQAWVATETNGTWGPGTGVTAPSNAASNPAAFFTGVSCASAGNCVAVGNYTDNTSTEVAMAAIETNGAWGRATEVNAPWDVTPPSPITGITGWRTTLAGVSCTSTGTCVAVGEYVSILSGPSGWAATETGGTWGPATAVTVAKGTTNLQGVSCTSPGNCTAVGGYAGLANSVAATETNGTWGQATEVTAPSNGDGVQAFLTRVSCTSPGNCVAVGTYEIPGGEQAMEAIETNGSWGQAAEVTAPSNASSGYPHAYLQGVSCTSPGNCLAVGQYGDNSGAYQGMEAIETNGSWGQATEVTAPSNVADPSLYLSTTALNGVSCTQVGKCVGVGTYNSTHGYAGMAASSL